MFLVTGTMIKLREILIDFEQNQDTDTMFCCLGMVLCFVLSRYVTMFSVSSMLICALSMILFLCSRYANMCRKNANMCCKYDTIFCAPVMLICALSMVLNFCL